jgi:hypothetical protein
MLFLRSRRSTIGASKSIRSSSLVVLSKLISSHNCVLCCDVLCCAWSEVVRLLNLLVMPISVFCHRLYCVCCAFCGICCQCSCLMVCVCVCVCTSSLGIQITSTLSCICGGGGGCLEVLLLIVTYSRRSGDYIASHCCLFFANSNSCTYKFFS